MAHRDLKNSSRKGRQAPAARRNGGGGVVMGMVIGLIVGVVAVVAVVMYFSRAGTPFSNMKKLEATEAADSAQSAASTPTQILAPGITLKDENSKTGPAEAPPAPASVPSQTRPKPAAAASTQSPAADDGQRFDFYKILPGQADAVSGDSSAAKTRAAPAHVGKAYLQVASFQNQDDADNLKAKLALIGVEATIQSVTVQGHGMVHRVRIGPFSRSEDFDRMQALLKQNGIK